MTERNFSWRILSTFIMLALRATGKRFYCKALNGDSGYNISINSDLTVSCNCRDYSETGVIGSLEFQDLPEIFAGKKATYFRKSLSRGRLPIPACLRCPELCRIKKNSAGSYLDSFKLPSLGIMVENTTECNLNCVSCPSKQIRKTRIRQRMSLEDIRRVSSCIRRYGIKLISYFKFGEPFFSDRILEELDIIKNENPDVVINASTNGLALDSDIKLSAALKLDHIYFSIDGPEQKSLSRYQSGGNFDKSYSNMKNLVKLRNSLNKKTPVLEWKYVLFRWNDSRKQIETAIGLAKAADVDSISFWPTTKPILGLSFRYYLGSGYLRNLGRPFAHSRKIDFRNKPKCCLLA